MRPTGVHSRALACPDCDLLFTAPSMHEGERATCPRCDANLFVNRADSLQRAAAYVVASAFLFCVANIFPFLTLKKDYRGNTMLLYQSVSGLINVGFSYLAVAVAVFMLIAPALLIFGLLYLLIPLHQGRRLPWAIPLCRMVASARHWQMLDVYLLGVMVSFLKLGKLATLTLGTSFWAFVALILCLTLSLAAIDFRELWARLEVAR